MTDLIRTEGSEDIAELLAHKVDDSVLQQIECVATDQPSPVLFHALRKCCPDLKCVYLDSVHICIVYNASFWHKTTPGQVMLRRMQAKFQRVDAAVHGDDWNWGPYFSGCEAMRMSESEQLLRNMILDGSMAKPRAVAVPSWCVVGLE